MHVDRRRQSNQFVIDRRQGSGRESSQSQSSRHRSRGGVMPIAVPSATPCAASTSHLHQSGDYGGRTCLDPYSRRSGLKKTRRVKKSTQKKKKNMGRERERKRTEPRPRPRTEDLLPVCAHVAEPPHISFAAYAAPLSVPCLSCAAFLTFGGGVCSDSI